MNSFRTGPVLLTLLAALSLPSLGRGEEGPAGRAPAAPPSGAADSDVWKPLFDGKSLAGWKRTEFAGGGEVRVEQAFRGGPPAVVVDMGALLSGFHWTREVPRTNYEIALEAMKLDGSDFMLGLTFPVGESHASLILGGWGGGVVGISSIDGMDASENATTRSMAFQKDRWYRVRVRVTPEKIQAWLDDKPIVDQEITGRRIGLRPGEIILSVPLGIATYQTSAAYRDIRLRELVKEPRTSPAAAPPASRAARPGPRPMRPTSRASQRSRAPRCRAASTGWFAPPAPTKSAR
jgi:hypothetical protein